MLARDLFDLRQRLDANHVMFAYSGYMTEEVRLAFGQILKQKLNQEDASTTTIRSVFAVFVEQMQNVIRYSTEKMAQVQSPSAEELRYGIIAIFKQAEDYALLSGNLVHSSDVGRISERLAEIQKMDRNQLKTLYKEKLREGPDEHSKGAGIGFIEIARRANKPIEFDFVEVADKTSFFVLKASI